MPTANQDLGVETTLSAKRYSIVHRALQVRLCNPDLLKRSRVAAGPNVAGGFESPGRVDADHARRPERLGRPLDLVPLLLQSAHRRVIGILMNQKAPQLGRRLPER